jgi:hypothetical protein
MKRKKKKTNPKTLSFLSFSAHTRLRITRMLPSAAEAELSH